MSECDICRGSRKIRLPIYRQVATECTMEKIDVDEISRVYPCPECSNQESIDNVAVLEVGTLVDSRVPAEYVNVAKMSALRRLAEEMAKGGLVVFTRGPSNELDTRYEIRATVGIVSPGTLTSLERRIADRQDVVARDVADEAARQINNWGSYYGHESLRKDDAIRFVREAIKTVLNKREKVAA